MKGAGGTPSTRSWLPMLSGFVAKQSPKRWQQLLRDLADDPGNMIVADQLQPLPKRRSFGFSFRQACFIDIYAAADDTIANSLPNSDVVAGNKRDPTVLASLQVQWVLVITSFACPKLGP